MPRAAKPDFSQALVVVPVGSGVWVRAAIGERGLRRRPWRWAVTWRYAGAAPRRTGSRSREAPPSWRYGRDQSRLAALATERCQRLEARPGDHTLCSLHQLRDRAAVRVARGNHPRGSPGRVWGHLRGDRASTRRRVRRPRAAPPAARGPRAARPILGRSPCGGRGPSTSRSRDHTKEGSSATRLGRSAWPSDHSVAAAHVSDAGRRMTASAFQPPDSQPSISLRIRGGDDAPTRARRWVHAQLAGHIPATTASDAALLVSELVTNSVVHADVGAGRVLTVELAAHGRAIATRSIRRCKTCGAGKAGPPE